MIHKIISLTLCIVLLTSCGGRTPSPVMVSQFGGSKKKCTSLVKEMHMISDEMHKLLPKTNKTGKNVALGVIGI